MPNGGGHPSCQLCTWSTRDTATRNHDTYCRKHETAIINAAHTFCADLVMPTAPAFIAEENITVDYVYIWTEIVHRGAYYADIVLFAPFSDYKTMIPDDIIRKTRAINATKQAEFEAKRKPSDP